MILGESGRSKYAKEEKGNCQRFHHAPATSVRARSSQGDRFSGLAINRISLIDPVSDPRPATSQLHRDLYPAQRSAAPAAAAAAAAQKFRFLFTGALRAVSSLFPQYCLTLFLGRL